MIRILALIAFIGLAVPAQAQLLQLRAPQSAAQVCPICGRVHAPAQPLRSAMQNLGSGQAVAQARANYMARNDLRRHPPRSAGDFASVGRFEGVGWSSNANEPHANVPTCVAGGGKGTQSASGRWSLVGDAIARGPRGTYRVRIWR